MNTIHVRLTDTYDPNEPLWSALAYDGIWALALCLNRSIPSNALQGYSVGDYHNTKLKRECFNTLNFDGVSEAIRVSSERAFVDSLSLTNDRYETVIIMQFCSNEIHFLCSDDCASCTDCYLSCAHDCVQEAPIHQGYVSQDHSPHVCRLLHAGCDLIPLCKLAEQRFKIYWTGTSEWMHLSDKHKHIPPHWLHIGLWAHLVNAGKCEALITLHHFSNQSRFHCDNKKSVTESTLHAPAW